MSIGVWASSGTPSACASRAAPPLPKIGIGALALAAFLVYMLVLGRRAVRAGETGDLTEYEAGSRRVVAA